MANGRAALIRVTAWHEAGHALAILREGRPLVTAQVYHDFPGNGFSRLLQVKRSARYNPWRSRGDALASWKDTVDYSLAEIRILLAGPLAEAKALNQPLRTLGAVSDLVQCQQIARRLHVLYEFIVDQTGLNKLRQPLDLVNMQRARVRRWLGRPTTWRAIETVANHLNRTGKVTHGEVLRAYLEARSSHQATLSLDWTLPGSGLNRMSRMESAW